MLRTSEKVQKSWNILIQRVNDGSFCMPGEEKIFFSPGMPELEKLRSLAQHQSTMCIYLSITMLDKVVEELIAGGYAEDTPIAIVQRASWPEQKIVRGTLKTIVQDIEGKNIDRTAMIVVSRCLGADYELSRLYAPEFSHMFRKAVK